MEMSSSSPQNPNPRKWRFTWETLTHIPTLRLFLFNPYLNPSTQCKNFSSSLDFEQSLLFVAWIEEIDGDGHGSIDFLLRVPVPRVLIDPASPVDSSANEDHIEVKLALLLPVDHPLVAAGFESILDLGEDEGFGRQRCISDRLLPLSLDSDLKSLSSGQGVQFYCRVCSTKLTRKPLRSFVEMPSVNWREVADNWFGACCCSFGGISEKLVLDYVNSYICAEGACLLDGTSVIICKDDLAECEFRDFSDGNSRHDSELNLVGKDDLTDTVIDSGSKGRGGVCCVNGHEGIADVSGTLSSSCHKEERSRSQNSSFFMPFSSPNHSEKVAQGTIHCFMENKTCCVNDANFLEYESKLTSGDGEKSCPSSPTNGLSTKDCYCVAEINSALNHADERYSHGVSILSTESTKLWANQKQLQIGAIGSGFMVRSANLSNDIKWVEFQCCQCSSLLGSYPSVKDGHTPIDGGVRLFKCCISTSLPVGGPGDIFRKHTLQRVFVNQLLESAADELSFRTVVRDLRTKSPMLQIVVLNSKAWSCTGYCLDTENGTGPGSKIDLHPVVKVVFSDCSNATEAESRKIAEWATKNHADEAYMMQCQIKELIESLKSAQEGLPRSCSFMQGLLLSSMDR
ncbi:uncharacterized protein LOC131234878 [Magnolia sinica]|uniref:uncharacterized protein LOC131234878 n=1 Tax=Magnolia sinica TaxID=86752 RepID=UPI002658E577|nr:uncharacterized protein LOC131234878 [Magnolia sinica]